MNDLASVRDPRAFVDAYTRVAKPLYTARGEAWWALATTGSDEAAAQVRDTDLALRTLHADADRAAWIREQLESIDDPQLERCLVTLLPMYEQNPASEDARAAMSARIAELQKAYATFRPEVDGAKVSAGDIATALTDSDDSDHREAMWTAAHAIGAEVAEPIREAARARNEVARSHGYRDHYAMALAHQEIDEDWLFDLLNRLEKLTRDPWRKQKAVLDARLASRFEIDADALRPWHYADPFLQRVPKDGAVTLDPWYADVDLVDIATRFYDGLGMNVRDVLERSDLDPRDGKNPHAFCTHIDRSGDIRILCNMQNNERWMGTLLHELGHAAYERYLDPELPWLLRRAAHTLTTEAIAMWMGRQAREVDLLTEYVDAPAFEITPLRGELRRRQALGMLLLVRWVLVMSHFERALYADPDREDLDELWVKLREKYQGITYPEGRVAPDWAAKIHFAIAPVYYHNYLLGELLASQLSSTLLEESGDRSVVDSQYVGEALIARVFAPGRSLGWDALVEQATGHPLSTAPFVREFVHRDR